MIIYHLNKSAAQAFLFLIHQFDRFQYHRPPMAGPDVVPAAAAGMERAAASSTAGSLPPSPVQPGQIEAGAARGASSPEQWANDGGGKAPIAAAAGASDAEGSSSSSSGSSTATAPTATAASVTATAAPAAHATDDDGLSKATRSARCHAPLPFQLQRLFFSPRAADVKMGGRLLRLAHRDPHVYVIDDFLSESEYQYFEQIIDQQYGKFRASYTDDSATGDQYVTEERTSAFICLRCVFIWGGG